MPELETSKLLTVLSEMPKELLEGYTGYAADTGESYITCVSANLCLMLCLKSILCQTYLNKVITCNRLDDCQKSHAFEHIMSWT